MMKRDKKTQASLWAQNPPGSIFLSQPLTLMTNAQAILCSSFSHQCKVRSSDPQVLQVLSLPDFSTLPFSTFLLSPLAAGITLSSTAENGPPWLHKVACNGLTQSICSTAVSSLSPTDSWGTRGMSCPQNARQLLDFLHWVSFLPMRALPAKKNHSKEKDLESSTNLLFSGVPNPVVLRTYSWFCIKGPLLVRDQGTPWGARIKSRCLYTFFFICLIG